MTIARMKAGDTGTVFVDVLLVDDTPIPLTGATVKMLLQYEDGTRYSFTLDPGDIDTGTSTVQYRPFDYLPADFPSTPGKYKHEWEVTSNDGSIITVPNGRHNTLIIVADLN